MKKTAFWIRFSIFILAAFFPALHPGVVRAFDFGRIWLSFALVPSACILAFYGPSFPRVGKFSLSAGVAIALVLLTIGIDGISATFLSSLVWAIAAYGVTALAFRKGWYRILYVESLYILWMAWRLTEFSRSSSVIADASRAPVAVIFFAALSAWIAYAIVVYLLEYSDGKPPRASRAIVPFLVSIAVLSLFSFALFNMPEKITDYVQKLNTSDERIPPRKGHGNIQGNGKAESGQAKSGEGKVVSASDSNWQRNPGESASDGNQHLVMVVESPVDILYIAKEYRGVLDPVKGFVADPAYYANSLAKTPYLETWVNPEPGTDGYRTPVWIEVYSSIADKMTSWLPYRIEPTVLDEKNFPLRFSYRALSLVSNGSLTGKLPFVPPLAGRERDALAPYLAVTLPESDLAPFRKYVMSLVSGERTYDGKIKKILEGFGNCRYEVSGNDEMPISAIKRFLFETRTGDCSEFSNTAALLARIAGIPSRVVTGYAVRKDLQTAAHRYGIRQIMQKFPPLAGKNPDHLFLVTTAHAHSWPEFYIPGSGWVDFESTEHALPPEAGGDPNSADIVIPEFDSIAGSVSSRIPFPWLLVVKIAFVAFAVAVVFLWVKRTATILALSIRARSGDASGAKARYRLFLIRLAARGYRAKRDCETPREYGFAFPEIADIMALYEVAVYHPDSATRRKAKDRLDADTRFFLSSRRNPLVFLRELSGACDGGLT